MGLIDDEFEEVGASGRRWDRAAVVALLAVSSPADAAIDAFDATRLGRTVVLVTYRFPFPSGCTREMPALVSRQCTCPVAASKLVNVPLSKTYKAPPASTHGGSASVAKSSE